MTPLQRVAPSEAFTTYIQCMRGMLAGMAGTGAAALLAFAFADVAVSAALLFAAAGGLLGAVFDAVQTRKAASLPEALQENETRFRQLAENVEGVFWLCTQDRMLYVSSAYETIWGRSRESLYDDPTSYLESIHPEDRPRVEEQMAEVWGPAEASEQFATEYRVVQPDGAVRWVRSLASRVTVEDGEDRYAGYAVDITRRRQQEEALRQSEERWRRLVETHMEPILISVEGVIRYINPRGAEFFGADAPDEMIGRSVFEFVVSPFQAEIDRRIEQIEAGQATEPFEHWMQRLDGKKRIVESYSVPIRYDGKRAAQTVVRDITEWREAQGKLEYRIQLENLIVDLSTRLIDTAAKITDATIEEALGRIGPFVGADRSYVFLLDDETLSNTHEWCAPGVTPQKDFLQDVPQAEVSWLMTRLRELRPIHIPRVDELPPEADPERRILQAQDILSLVLVPMTEGHRLIGFVGFDAVQQARTWADETIMLLRVLGDTFANALARKETEQALREREAQYRTVVENVRDIVFQTDAEGRWTFLNPAWEALAGYSVEESLGRSWTRDLRGEAIGGRLCAPIESGKAASCRCEVRLRTKEGAVRWMTLFSQATYDESGTMTGVVGTLHESPNLERVELRTLYREIENGLRVHFTNGRSIDVQMDTSQDVVLADRDLLHHILGNLMSNALKYSAGAQPVEVSMRVNDDHLHVRIRDYGIGIPSEDQPHLFRAFCRGSNVGNVEGSGLGMTIVKRAVDVYGGTIAVESRPGEGTTFEVTLPAAASKTEASLPVIDALDGTD